MNPKPSRRRCVVIVVVYFSRVTQSLESGAFPSNREVKQAELFKDMRHVLRKYREIAEMVRMFISTFSYGVLSDLSMHTIKTDTLRNIVFQS